MRILHLAYADTAGVPGRWAAAHRDAGHTATLLIEREDDLGYGHPHRVVRWSGSSGRTGELMAGGYDAVFTYDHPVYARAALGAGLPFVFQALGTASFDNAEELRELLPSAALAGAETPDLARALALPWRRSPFAPLSWFATRDDAAACHAPCNRAIKNTEAIVRVCEADPYWRLVLVEDMANSECLRIKASCALYLDQFGPRSGFGVNAIEAMSLGMPVVTRADRPEWLAYRHAGCPVLTVSDVSELPSMLLRLRDHELRRQLGEEGARYVRRCHHPGDRVREDEEALGWR